MLVGGTTAVIGNRGFIEFKPIPDSPFL